MKSRERSKVLKEANYTCSVCNKKQTKAGKDKTKWVLMQVHHVSKIDIWNEVINLIEKKILRSEQVCMCTKCHKAHHEKEKDDEK